MHVLALTACIRSILSHFSRPRAARSLANSAAYWIRRATPLTNALLSGGQGAFKHMNHIMMHMLIHMHYESQHMNHMMISLSRPLSSLPPELLGALQAAAVYSTMNPGAAEGSVQATFQVVYLTGWSPDPSQRGAAKRGSATVSMKDIQDGLQESP